MLTEWTRDAAKRRIYVNQSGKCYRCNRSTALHAMVLIDTMLVCRQCDIKVRLDNATLKQKEKRLLRKKRKRNKRKRR